MLREVLFRERNRQYAVSAATLSAVEEIGHVLLDVLLPPPKDEESLKARHAPLHARFQDLRRLIEEEVYEERYMDANVRAEAERDRARRAEELERAARERAALSRVAAWSDE